MLSLLFWSSAICATFLTYSSPVPAIILPWSSHTYLLFMFPSAKSRLLFSPGPVHIPFLSYLVSFLSYPVSLPRSLHVIILSILSVPSWSISRRLIFSFRNLPLITTVKVCELHQTMCYTVFRSLPVYLQCVFFCPIFPFFRAIIRSNRYCVPNTWYSFKYPCEFSSDVPFPLSFLPPPLSRHQSYTFGG